MNTRSDGVGLLLLKLGIVAIKQRSRKMIKVITSEKCN